MFHAAAKFHDHREGSKFPIRGFCMLARKQQSQRCADSLEHVERHCYIMTFGHNQQQHFGTDASDVDRSKQPSRIRNLKFSNLCFAAVESKVTDLIEGRDKVMSTRNASVTVRRFDVPIAVFIAANVTGSDAAYDSDQ